MTYSRMTLGEPMLKAAMPPRSPTNQGCSNPEIVSTLGTNIAPDPGFELTVAAIGSGPLGNGIPIEAASIGEASATGLVWEDANPQADWTTADNGGGWFIQQDTSYGSPYPNTTSWVISTSAPKSGTYHARQAGPIVSDSPYLCVDGFSECATGRRVTSAVAPNDIVGFSLYHRGATGIDVTWGGWNAWMVLQFLKSDMTSAGFYSTSQYLDTTTYRLFEFSQVAPTDSAFVIAKYFFSVLANSGEYVDVDEASVTILR